MAVDYAEAVEMYCETQPPQDALCAAALLDLIEKCLHASQSEWLFLRELRVGTGFRNNSGQRLDAFALNCLPHMAMKRVCYEVKTSRADFLGELKQPLKRRIGLRYSNEFYFVTPPGLLKSHEIPVECGLIEASSASCLVTIPAPWRDTPGPTWQFAASMLRNLRRQLHEKPPPPPKQQKLEW